ncbi:Crp/Fnr family transcriptional regulator [Spirochaeta lutea]|uniref:HTH crp-type domain-containing protein n=1 Tax=Spirochaeta lutea TaxID=1480694 RepID=A0A098QTT9_9SPIO|nr:Crp/Fnr family transcriptional regulator [Spirochaeta lutea]KGE70991.1 hypothetical protein DC28_13775 [Spirochaeta lutea]
MSPQELIRILGLVPAFNELSIQELTSLVTKNFFPISRYEKQKRVALRSDPYEELAVILSGTLRAELNDIEGHSFIVETLAAPQVLASAVFFSSRSRFPVDLVAQTDVRIMRITRAQVFQLLQEYPPLLHGLLRDMGDRLQFLAQRLRMSQFGSIRQQLSLYILDLLSDQGDSNAPVSETASPTRTPRSGSITVTIPVTRQALADTFGVARQSLSRVLSEMEHQGLLTCRHRTLEILNLPALRGIARGVG